MCRVPLLSPGWHARRGAFPSHPPNPNTHHEAAATLPTLGTAPGGGSEPTVPLPRLRKDVRVVAHVLRLTARLARALDASSQRLQDELHQRLQRSAARAAAAPQP